MVLGTFFHVPMVIVLIFIEGRGQKSCKNGLGNMRRFLAVQDSSIGDLVTHSVSQCVSHVLISATSERTAELS